MRFEPRYGRKGSPAAPRKPLRSFVEMADEFGMSQLQLAQTFRASRIKPPEPMFRHRSRAAQNAYYDPDAVRDWWKAHQAEKEREDAR